jgi:glycosyltransferase involved in cell wall biosynthesis
VQEFVAHNETGLLTSFFDPAALADKMLELLENRSLAESLRVKARHYAEKSLSMTDYLNAYEGIIERLSGQSLAEPSRSHARRGTARKA